MTSNEIYEAAKLKAFNSIRHQRDAHAPQEIGISSDKDNPFKQTLFEIEDENANSYSWVMKQAKKESLNMFRAIIVSLLKKYKIPYELVTYNKQRVHPEPVIAFVTREDNTLYVVQNINDGQLQKEVLASFFISHGAKNIKMIMMIHDYAYRLRYDHNDDESDPSRGTDLFSVRYLFETLFGVEEYECFKTFEQKYSKEIRQYLGYQVIKTLTPNALYSFKKTVESSLLSFPYRKYISELTTETISDNLMDAIKKQFIDRKYYKALIGNKDFAQSFLTAEWLYDSMKSAGWIDYTAVAMGYFKSVEQLMFELIKRHIGEGRTIKKNGSNGFDELTQDNLDNDNLDTTLGALIGFLKYYPNRDLFIAEIRSDRTIQDILLGIFNLAKEDRNVYFHKVNIKVWNKSEGESPDIESAHILSYLILAILLGAYEYSDQDKIEIGIPEENNETDYYKLCSYINYNADQLFYISMNGVDIVPVFAMADDNIIINRYGDPIFSGIYFRRVYGVEAERIEINAAEIVKNHIISTGESEKYSENTLPVKIYSGKMSPGKEGMIFSGPLELIYENGRYMLPKQILQSGY